MRITFTHEGKNYTFQLDYFPEMSVDNVSNLISSAFGFKDKILLSTYDDEILFPGIRFTKLFLISPEKYGKLKLFVYNKEPASSLKTELTTGIGLSTKYKLNYEIGAKSSSILNTNNEDTNLNTTPIHPSTNREFTSYKFDRNNLNKDGFDKDNLSNVQNPNLNPKSELNDLILQQPPQPQSLNTDNNMYKPLKPQNFAGGLDNFGMGGRNDLNANQRPNKYEYKMDFKKYPSQSSLDVPTKSTSSSKFDLIAPSTIGGLPNTRESKDLNDLNNPTTNYIFNSGELYTYDHLKKNQKPPSSGQLNEDFTQPKPNYANLLQQQKNNPLNNQEPAMNSHKDDFKKFSSEKRTYRSNNSNLMNNLPSKNNLEDYQPQQYQKYNQSPLEENFERFPTEKFNRLSSRQNQNPNQQTPKIKDDQMGMNFTIGGGNFGKMGMRGNLTNFGFDKKTQNNLPSPGQFEPREGYKFSSQIGQKLEDKDME